MKFADHLKDADKKKLNSLKPKKEKVNWHELMNSNRRGMKRKKGGAKINA